MSHTPVALVVDDKSANRAYYCKMLLDMRIKGLEADNGQVALNMLEASPVDCIFLDFQMPVMKGDAFLTSLRSHSNTKISGIPVIMMSTDLSKNLNAVNSGQAQDWLVKRPTVKMMQDSLNKIGVAQPVQKTCQK